MSEPEQGEKHGQGRKRPMGKKANLDPRAVEKGSRSKDTKVAKAAREKGRGIKGRVEAVDKLATNRPSAQNPCNWQKDKETEEISGQSKQLAPWCVAPCGKRATWKW